MPETSPAPDLKGRLQAALGDRYTILNEIGRGGMATVYLAEDLRHGRQVAIKVMRPELSGIGYEPERFLREIRIAARLNHPAILPIFDSGEVEEVDRVEGGTTVDGGSLDSRPARPSRLLYYTMPYMGCESLRDRLSAVEKLSVEEAVWIARAVAAALDYAHRQGVVHRDIKPENIMLHEGHPVVADFGIARALELSGVPAGPPNLSQPGITLGTPAYMSPEQATADEVDGRSDLYSLACVLYEMLSGHPPFHGAGARTTMLQHAMDTPDPIRTVRANVPSSVERALTRALAKDRTQRFPTATDFARSLEAVSTISTPATPSTASIAVLPFANTSPDPDAEYLSDGITDELINALAKVKGLRVASRSATFALKGARKDSREIGRLFDVTAVLEGSVRKVGDRLRITAQLSNAADGSLLWSERFDRAMKDVFEIQEEIAETIVSTLRAKFFTELGDPTPRRYTENLKAWNLYLRGRYAWNQRNQAAIHEGIRYFEQAIAEDPSYALAYTGLSDSHALLIDYRGVPVAEGMQLAEKEARKALEIDDSLAEAHTSLGWVTFVYKWEWAEAEREFRRAIELNPRYASARQWYAWLLLALGRYDEAVIQHRAAADLDPTSVSIRRSLGWLYIYLRDPDAAMEHLHRAITMNPSLEETHLILGHALAQKGLYREAESEFREAMSLSEGNTRAVSALGAVAVAQGRADEAQAILEGLYTRARDHYVSPVDFTTLHIALGETDKAFEWLERTVEQRRGWLAYLRTEPQLDPIRSDPRFTTLLRRMNLA